MVTIWQASNSALQSGPAKRGVRSYDIATEKVFGGSRIAPRKVLKRKMACLHEAGGDRGATSPELHPAPAHRYPAPIAPSQLRDDDDFRLPCQGLV